MRGIFSALHARAFCHATEDLDKVKTALEFAIGKGETRLSETEGHHGNSIVILEKTLDGQDEIERFFSGLGKENLAEILSSLSSRIDDSCNLFIRLDKQAAFEERIKLGSDDVISVRIRVQSYPSRCDIAASAVREHLSGFL